MELSDADLYLSRDHLGQRQEKRGYRHNYGRRDGEPSRSQDQLYDTFLTNESIAGGHGRYFQDKSLRDMSMDKYYDESESQSAQRSEVKSTDWAAQDNENHGAFNDIPDLDSVASSVPGTRIRLHRSGSVDISVDSSEEHPGFEEMSELENSSEPPLPPYVVRAEKAHYTTAEPDVMYSSSLHGMQGSRVTASQKSSSVYSNSSFKRQPARLSSRASIDSFPQSPHHTPSSSTRFDRASTTSSSWARAHQIQNVPARSAAVISAMSALQDKIRSLEKGLDQERERTLTMRAEMESEKQSYESKIRTLCAENEELESKLRQSEEAKHSSCRNAESFRSRLADVSAQLEKTQIELESLKQCNADTEEQLANIKLERTRIEEDLSNKLVEGSTQLEMRESRVKSLQEELVAMESQKIEAQAAIRNLLVLNEDLMNKLSQATSQSTTKRASSGGSTIKKKKSVSSGIKRGATRSSIAATNVSSKTSPVASQQVKSVSSSKKKAVRIKKRNGTGAMTTRKAKPQTSTAKPGVPDYHHEQNGVFNHSSMGYRKTRGPSLDKELFQANGDKPVPFILGANIGPSFSIYGRVQESLANHYAYGIQSPRERQRKQKSSSNDESEYQVSGDGSNSDENEYEEYEEANVSEVHRPFLQVDETEEGVSPRNVLIPGNDDTNHAPRFTTANRFLSSAQEAALAHAQKFRIPSPRSTHGLRNLETSLRRELDELRARYQESVTYLSRGQDGTGVAVPSLSKSRELTDLVERIEIKSQQLAALDEMERSSSGRPRSPVRSPEAYERKVHALRTLHEFRDDPPFL